MHQYKYGIVLDTNVFIHLSQQNHYPYYVYEAFLRHMVFNKEFLFIIPEQIVVEWKRVIKEKEEIFVENEKKPLLNALKFAKHIDNDEQAEKYKESIRQALKIKDRIHKYIFKKRIRAIDDILFNKDHPLYGHSQAGIKTIVKRTLEINNLLVNLSLNHTAPFFGDDKGKGKINEMADALIFFSACHFAKNNPELCESYIFVTDETNFSKGPILHQNIKGFADEANLEFYCSFKTLIDGKFSDLKEKAEKYTDLRPKPVYLSDNYFKTCSKCKEEVHENNDGYLKNELWHYRCSSCGHEWHEYEYIT